MVLTHLTRPHPSSHRTVAGFAVLGTLLSALSGSVGAAPPSAPAKIVPSFTVAAAEPLLARVFTAIEANKLNEALALTDQLLLEKPNFHLAHLIRGDLLQAKTRPLSGFGAASAVNANAASAAPRVQELREEALLRLKAYRQKPPADSVPRYLLQMKADQRYAVIVDTKKSRLYIYENAQGQPRFLADYYISQGKNGTEKAREGDQKTPLGVYHVTDYVPKSKLPDLYGAGAFPISYPNEWDKRLGKSGHGIWLHGTPSNTFARAPRATDGCVVLANADFESIGRFMQTGTTPVVISEEVEWLKLDDWNRERTELTTAIEKWRRDWESLNIERYLAHYHQEFNGDGVKLAEWSSRKRQVNTAKEWVKVGVNNVSMLRYPGKEDMVVVTFDQDYRSSNLATVAKKKQYWVRTPSTGGKNSRPGSWKIIEESTV